MKFIKDFFIDHGLFIAIFSVGFLLGAIFPSILSLEVEAKISISDIFSMVLTSVVGIYLAITIANNQSSSRFEKEFLIQEVKRITEFMDRQAVFTDTRSINALDAAKVVKDLNILIINVEIIIPLSSHCSGASTEEVRSTFKKLRHSITSLPSMSGIIHPTTPQRQSIVQNINQFRRDIFVLVTSINSYR